MSDERNISETRPRPCSGRIPWGRAVAGLGGALAAALCGLAACHLASPGPGTPQRYVPDGPPYTGFHEPRRVTIRGYTGDAMEPFVTPDGRYLLFNNANDPSVDTNLHYAARVDGLTFDYRGEIAGVNTPALDAVSSLDRAGTLYFVSTRSYDRTLSTLYRGRFHDGTVTGVALVPGVSLRRRGLVIFDAEVSADGDSLLVVDGDFSTRPAPSTAVIALATRDGDGFRRNPDGAALLQDVNTNGLNYAPALSVDGRELFFTRVARMAPEAAPAIYRATRRDRSARFGIPQRVAAITGFAEAPSLDPGGHALYYHARENGRFVLCRVTR